MLPIKKLCQHHSSALTMIA